MLFRSRDYKKYINELLKLKPDMFHISDCDLKNEIDEHLNIGDGELDFGFLNKCVLKSDSRYVTLETPRKNIDSLDEDLKNIGNLRKLFQNNSPKS